MSSSNKISISLATSEDRSHLYEIRHQVYAVELGQHSVNDQGILTNELDLYNVYFVAKIQNEIVGFVSVTPPSEDRNYSTNKYFKSQELPFEMDSDLYELRILTVLPEHRSSNAAVLLLWSAYRWIDACGGKNVLAIAKTDILCFYLKLGFTSTGKRIKSGKVNFELIHSRVQDLNKHVELNLRPLFKYLEPKCNWNLDIPFFKPAACYHGGAFFKAIGEEFDDLERKDKIINADVLDAWFPPAPQVLNKLKNHLSWISRTSPPTDCAGMIRSIAKHRGIEPKNVLPGAGSSDLIFLAFREWLDESSKVLILDPSYGEYRHILENVICCHVDKFLLSRENHYRVDLNRLQVKVVQDYDLVVIVNPNSPTGQYVPKMSMKIFLDSIPKSTRVWIDETYVEYVGRNESLEKYATQRENIVICKSMSKVYALSGLRAAYLCASPYQLEALRAITPPWAVSLPGQVAAVAALENSEYYQARYRETHALRTEFASKLAEIDMIGVTDTCSNFVLCQLNEDTMSSEELVNRCREKGLFIRNVQNMGECFRDRVVRIAVKDRDTNLKMIKIIGEELNYAHNLIKQNYE